MQTNANNSIIVISGGIAVKTQLKDGIFYRILIPFRLRPSAVLTSSDGICTQEPFTTEENDPAMNAAWTQRSSRPRWTPAREICVTACSPLSSP